MDLEHPGGQQRQKTGGEGTGFDSGWWECQCSVLPHTRGGGDLSSRIIPHLFTSTLPLLNVSALCQPQLDVGRV